ncbi:MAG TPA: glucose-1-phosphate adenylyltransferase subunit GlgD [Anaerolineae bacterium]|nr:glucose-1-phosphate adenylyltransferase subunit GlgD [Anaerolineae bacterium]
MSPSVIAMILAGGAGPGLAVLTARRPASAVPFAGKYRVIDFPLSNCVNSGIYNVAVLTQYMPRPLNEHIRSGKPWDLDRAQGGVRLLQPYQTRPGEGLWEKGSADALRFNLDVIEESGADLVLVLSGNHVYKMNYQPLIEFHQSRRADVTIAVRPVSPHQTSRFGMVTMDVDNRIIRFEEKPRRTRATLASMGIYVFNAAVLIDWLRGTGKHAHDLGGEVIPGLVKAKRVYAYEFEGYWANVGAVPAFYEANMALLADIPALELNDRRWTIHTRSEQYPPVWFSEEARVMNNLLSDGARIEGRVVRSIIGPGVVIEAGAEVRDSIIMHDAIIHEGAVVDRAILDEDVVVGAGAEIGVGENDRPNPAMSDLLNTGITLVGQKSRIPAGAKLGRNVVVGVGVSEDAFTPFDDLIVPSGTNIAWPEF